MTKVVPATVKSLSGQKKIFFAEMIAFLDNVLIFSIRIVGSFDFLFSLGVCRVEVIVESEELNDASDIDDGYKDPSDHSFIEKKLSHLLIKYELYTWVIRIKY